MAKPSFEQLAAQRAASRNLLRWVVGTLAVLGLFGLAVHFLLAMLAFAAAGVVTLLGGAVGARTEVRAVRPAEPRPLSPFDDPSDVLWPEITAWPEHRGTVDALVGPSAGDPYYD